jgi:hypothetical protein
LWSDPDAAERLTNGELLHQSVCLSHDDPLLDIVRQDESQRPIEKTKLERCVAQIAQVTAHPNPASKELLSSVLLAIDDRPNSLGISANVEQDLTIETRCSGVHESHFAPTALEVKIASRRAAQTKNDGALSEYFALLKPLQEAA